MSPSFMHTRAARRDPLLYAQKRKEQRARYYAATAGYPKRRWTEWEDRLVLQHSIPDRELSRTLQRSMKAISTRRYVLNKQIREGEDG